MESSDRLMHDARQFLLTLVPLLMTGCATTDTRQVATQQSATTANVKPVTEYRAARKSPDWIQNRTAWCMMREGQKAKRKSSTEPIAGTTNPYLILVHDEICARRP